MWLCDDCNIVNIYSPLPIITTSEIICVQCGFIDIFLTSRSRLLVLSASYGEYDKQFWSSLDINYIGIGRDYGSKDSFVTIFRNDWNISSFWDQSVIPKAFDSIFIDASVPFIFGTNRNLLKNAFDFIQRHSKAWSKLYFEKHDFNTLTTSYMAKEFVDNLNPLHNYSLNIFSLSMLQNDISVLQMIVDSGDWVLYDTDLNIQNDEQKHKCKWNALYKVHSQLKNT